MTARVFTSPVQIQNKILKHIQEKKSIGFVPTMGFLHRGHLELVDEALKQCDIVVVSIYVNKKQFGKNEDFSTYPEDFKHDKLKLDEMGVDYIFHPNQEDMYPDLFMTHINVEQLTGYLCGQSRPGHFDGVALIVTKLLNIIMPDKIYFGQKDYQQCLVIKQLIKDLNFRTEMFIIPIVRENSGLAMSSRNEYLSEEQKNSASSIYKTLNLLKEMILAGETEIDELKNKFNTAISQNAGTIDYIEFTEVNTLQPLKSVKKPMLIATAVFFGKTRLIDNIIIE